MRSRFRLTISNLSLAMRFHLRASAWSSLFARLKRSLLLHRFPRLLPLTARTSPSPRNKRPDCSGLKAVRGNTDAHRTAGVAAGCTELLASLDAGWAAPHQAPALWAFTAAPHHAGSTAAPHQAAFRISTAAPHQAALSGSTAAPHQAAFFDPTAAPHDVDATAAPDQAAFCHSAAAPPQAAPSRVAEASQHAAVGGPPGAP